MNNLNFTGVTETNRSEFHRLMQQYANELDEHQNRTTDHEMLKKWTDRIIEKQSERGKYLNLCYSDGTIAGFLFGRIDLPGDKGFTKAGLGCIVEFYVIPECRGKGCGREMFLHLQAMFRKDGARKIYLTADPVTGKPFWEAMGFIGTGEISPENGQRIFEKSIPDEAISFSIREFIDAETAGKIEQAQWNAHEQYDGIVHFAFCGKTETDCFKVIAENETGDVVGRLFCLQNNEDKSLWYYGDLFVVPEYRRRHIAQRMLEIAENVLFDKWCSTLRCYVEPENEASLALQAKAGFTERPYQSFNELINDGQLMFEKELSTFNVNEAHGKIAAQYIAAIFGRNAGSLHSRIIPYREWCGLLSSDDPDEKHFLICKGAVPCAYLKVNGLESGDEIGWISMLAVAPPFQRKGIGSYAVRYAEEFLRNAGKSRVKIHTTEDNLPARSLYEKCGYTRCDYTEPHDSSKLTFVKQVLEE